MCKNISKKVKEFISSYGYASLEDLSDETRIEDDLGITGDDAYDFMEDYQNEFEVDLTGFQFDKHFGPETSFDPRVLILFALLIIIFGFLGWENGLIPFVIVIISARWYFQKKNGASSNVLKIKHLIKAAAEKQWNYKYNKV